MADLAWFNGFQFFDSSGDPLNAGTINVYDSGTTSARTVYKDSAAATPWTQPITLDSAGRLTGAIYIPEGNWKYILKNSAGTTLVTDDVIPGAIAAASAAFAAPLRPILTKATGYTLVAADLGYLVRADATGGAFTLTLPSAAATTAGKGFDIQQVGTSGGVTIATVSSQTINGASTYVIRGLWDEVRIVSDGSNWTAEPTEPIRTSPAAKTTTYPIVVADQDKLILGDATGGGFTITLPTVALAGNGFRVGVKKIDSTTSVVTVDGAGAETIDGAADYLLTEQYQTAWFRCNGTVWYVESIAALPLLEGKHTIYVPVSSMLSSITSGPAFAQLESSTNDRNYTVLDFDTTADEHAQFQVAMPKSWNLGTVTFRGYWSTAGAVTTGIALGLEGGALSDNEAIDAAWGTAVVVTDDAQSAAGEIYVTAESAAVTIGGTPAAGDLCWFRVFRDVSDANDDMTQDMRLIGIDLFITLTTGNDA